MRNTLYFLATAAASGYACAAAYVLSPDGLSVARITPTASVAATAFDATLLPDGFTSTTATGGAIAQGTFGVGYAAGNGGALFQAVYTPPSAPPTGSALKWIQVVTTNLPSDGRKSPYLDSRSGVFYDWNGSVAPLPSGALPFFDRPYRDPKNLASLDQITWNASLFPAVVDGQNNIQVHDGVSWGWTLSKAPVGMVSGVFTNPQPATAVVSGVGTDRFAWGTGSPSSLAFSSQAFDTTPGAKFKLGRLTFTNGTNGAGTAADSVNLEISLSFDNIPEHNFKISPKLFIISTPNVEGDAQASADIVSGFGYMLHAFEGGTVSVDLMARLNSGLTRTGLSQGDGSDVDLSPFDPAGIFSIGDFSFENLVGDGFITLQVNEPSTYLLIVVALSGILALRANILTSFDRCRSGC